VVELTDAGAQQLAEVECAMAAVEEEVLGALDASQRETLYSLLQQASTGTVVNCTTAVHD
jgi:DNA-binding MarR family transcriptional regulator